MTYKLVYTQGDVDLILSPEGHRNLRIYLNNRVLISQVIYHPQSDCYGCRTLQLLTVVT